MLVVKIGGARGIALGTVCEDVVMLLAQGQRVVLVHGASDHVNRLCRRSGYEPRFLHSPSGYVSRYTDKGTRDIYVQAVSEFNAEIVRALNNAGVKAVGLTTPEQCVLRGERKRALKTLVEGRVRVVRDDYSGRPLDADITRLTQILDDGGVPVVPPLAMSPEDGFLNVDGDRVAGMIAGCLEADSLVLLSNVPGLLKNFAEGTGLISSVPRQEFNWALETAHGRMKKKVLGIGEALESGARRAVVADGRVPHPLQQALAGGGTWFES